MPRSRRICRLLICGWIASGIVFPIGCRIDTGSQPLYWNDSHSDYFGSGPEFKLYREADSAAHGTANERAR